MSLLIDLQRDIRVLQSKLEEKKQHLRNLIDKVVLESAIYFQEMRLRRLHRERACLVQQTDSQGFQSTSQMDPKKLLDGSGVYFF